MHGAEIAGGGGKSKLVLYAIGGIVLLAVIVMVARNSSSGAVATPSGYSESYLENIAATNAQSAIASQTSKLALGSAALTYLSQSDQDAAAVKVAQLQGASNAEIAQITSDQVVEQTRAQEAGAVKTAQVEGYYGYRTAVDVALPIAQTQAKQATQTAQIEANASTSAAQAQAKASTTNAWISGISNVIGSVLKFL